MEDEQKIHEAQFMQLVMSLQSSAWMMLGKTMHPLTGKIERNLDAAKSAIDTLIMLKAKTKGNLAKSEESFLSGAIQQLQINYVEELKNEKESPKEGKSKAAEKDPDRTNEVEEKPQEGTKSDNQDESKKNEKTENIEKDEKGIDKDG